MGKSNYYDKMEWQDSIKVIITQKLHQIRNWEFHNMLYEMSTIEIIENLIIENLTENRVIRRFGWPPDELYRKKTPLQMDIDLKLLDFDDMIHKRSKEPITGFFFFKRVYAMTILAILPFSILFYVFFCCSFACQRGRSCMIPCI